MDLVPLKDIKISPSIAVPYHRRLNADIQYFPRIAGKLRLFADLQADLGESRSKEILLTMCQHCFVALSIQRNTWKILVKCIKDILAIFFCYNLV